MPVPSAVISVPISWLPSILSRRARSTLRILPRSGRIAWKLRSRPCLAEPPALSPSTMNSSDLAGSRSWQSASLPGRLASRAPPCAGSARAPCAPPRARVAASTTLPTITLRLGRVLLEPARQSLADHARDDRRDLGARPACPWSASENLGSGILTERTQVRPSRMSSPVSATLSRFSDAAALGVGVDRARQRGAEARQVGAAVALRDVVGEAQASSRGSRRSTAGPTSTVIPSRSPRDARSAGAARCLRAVEVATKASRPPS